MKVYELRNDYSIYSLDFESESDEEKFEKLYEKFFGKSVQSLWHPLKIKICRGTESLPAGDFPHLIVGFPVMSRRAKEVLYDIIAPYVEFLPLQSDFGEEFYGINVLEEVDALDEEASEIKRFPDGRIMAVRKYVFKPDAVEGKVIFRIPQLKDDIFVTEAFVDRVQEYKLTGFKLNELWSSADFLEGEQRRSDENASLVPRRLT